MPSSVHGNGNQLYGLIRETNPTVIKCGMDGDNHDGFPWDDIVDCIKARKLCYYEKYPITVGAEFELRRNSGFHSRR